MEVNKDIAANEDDKKIPVVFIEPFYGGSHKKLIDLLVDELKKDERYHVQLHTLPAKKWHWRARTSALYFSQIIPKLVSTNHGILFASSVLNLAELVALRPDIGKLRKILYFHENQLVYPVRHEQECDFQFGYNQILSSIVADKVIFNSTFNKTSFLSNINTFLKKVPDHRPRHIADKIQPHCQVIYFPLNVPISPRSSTNAPDLSYPLHILWPHRWEHDKGPHLFFQTLFDLEAKGSNFVVSVLGETFTQVPDVFEEAKVKLASRIKHWGFATDDEYKNILRQADVVISTAKHEFFGVAVMEAVFYGCRPICPNELVYPEIFPREYLYNTPNQLLKLLMKYCSNPELVRNKTVQVDLEQFSWPTLKETYLKMFEIKL